MITILNTSILTNFGHYTYTPISLEKIRQDFQCMACYGNHPCQYCGGTGFASFQSAIGHQSTAEILTELLGVTVPVNRIEYKQEIGDIAIVFKLKGRPQEGKILNRAEIEAIGYEFGFLRRIM